MRWYDKTLVCEYCDEHFEASRRDARFCSTKCRTAHNRREKRREEAKTGITTEWSQYGRQALAGIREEVPGAVPQIYDIYVEHGPTAAEDAAKTAYHVFANVTSIMNQQLRQKDELITKYREAVDQLDEIRRIVKA